jgi:hypothetical protein
LRRADRHPQQDPRGEYEAHDQDRPHPGRPNRFNWRHVGRRASALPDDRSSRVVRRRAPQCRSNSVQRRRLHVGAARRETRRAAQRSRARDCTGGEEVLPALLPRRMKA